METITAETHAAAVEKISDLMDLSVCPEGLNIVEETELQELIAAVSAYEEIAHPIDEPTPEAAAAFRAEQEEIHTHIIFYKRTFGKSHEMTGTVEGLRAWAKKAFRAGEIENGWEISKL